MKVFFGTLLLTFILLNSIQFSSQFFRTLCGKGECSSQNYQQENSMVSHSTYKNIRRGFQVPLPNDNYYVSNGNEPIHMEHHRPTGVVTVRQGGQVTEVNPRHIYMGDRPFTSMVGSPSHSSSRNRA